MADVEYIELSPALSRLIRRHNIQDYWLVWATPFAHTYVNKEDAIKEFRARWRLVVNSGYMTYTEPSDRMGIVKWRDKLVQLAKDLEALSHTDFDLLRRIKPEEAPIRPFTTINGKQIKLWEE
jgi:hypothetical protein